MKKRVRLASKCGSVICRYSLGLYLIIPKISRTALLSEHSRYLQFKDNGQGFCRENINRSTDFVGINSMKGRVEL